MPPGLLAALRRLRPALGGALGVISGRVIAQVDRLLGDAPHAVAGEHGGAIRHAPGRTRWSAPRLPAPPEAWAAAAEQAAALHPGARVERKARGFVLHYRDAPDAGPGFGALLRELAGGLARLRGARRQHGLGGSPARRRQGRGGRRVDGTPAVRRPAAGVHRRRRDRPRRHPHGPTRWAGLGCWSPTCSPTPPGCAHGSRRWRRGAAGEIARRLRRALVRLLRHADRLGERPVGGLAAAAGARADAPRRARRHCAHFAATEARVQAEDTDLPYAAVLEEVHRRLAATWKQRRRRREKRAASAAASATGPPSPTRVEALRRLKRRYRLVILSNVDRGELRAHPAAAGCRVRRGVHRRGRSGPTSPTPAISHFLIARLAERGIAREAHPACRAEPVPRPRPGQRRRPRLRLDRPPRRHSLARAPPHRHPPACAGTYASRRLAALAEPAMPRARLPIERGAPAQAGLRLRREGSGLLVQHHPRQQHQRGPGAAHRAQEQQLRRLPGARPQRQAA